MSFFLNINRKVISLFLLIALLLSIMAGCAQPDTNEPARVEPSSEPVNSAPAEITPPDDEPKEDLSTVSPLLWRVTSPDGQTLYLFGSIHAGTADVYPLPNAVMEAFGNSDYLAVEVDVVAFEQDMVAVAEMSFAMMYTDGSTVADEIGEELHGKAVAVLEELGAELAAQVGPGFPLELLNSFRPYFWMQLLWSISLNRAGMAYEYGLDLFFLNEAKSRGMEILEVETIDAQLDMMLGFSPPLQAALLESSLKLDEGAEAVRDLFEAWKLGDRQKLEELVKADFSDLPPEVADEYINAMSTQRDILMVMAAERYMAEGRNVFYVVGMGHMVGENGIVEQLIRNGYTVEQVQG
jgi:hypothetical protein